MQSSVTPARLYMLAFGMAGLLAFPPPSRAEENAYQLLLLDGYMVKWGERQLGVGASISYAFAKESLQFEGAINCGELAPIEVLVGETLSMKTLARETAAAFRVWERAAGLSFHEISDAREANIVFGAQGHPGGWAFANVSYAPDPQEGVQAIEQALVCLNPDHQWKVGFDGDEDIYDIRHTLIHEIGHALGLDHPGPSGQIMAFRYSEQFSNLQPGDLLGIQRLYGPAGQDDETTNHLVTDLDDREIKEEHTNEQDANNTPGTGVLGIGGREGTSVP